MSSNVYIALAGSSGGAGESSCANSEGDHSTTDVTASSIERPENRAWDIASLLSGSLRIPNLGPDDGVPEARRRPQTSVRGTGRFPLSRALGPGGAVVSKLAY